MKAVEVRGQIDHSGNLILEQPLDIKDKEVRVIILIPGKDDLSDEEWLVAFSSNSAFDFLKDEDEDIYSVKDGEPFVNQTPP